SRHLFSPAPTAANIFRRSRAVECRTLAVTAAPVQTHVLIRLREVAQRRPELARPHRTNVSLPDPAVANVDRMVCTSIAAGISEIFLCHDVCRGTRGTVPNFLPAPHPVSGMRGAGRIATADPAHRQLHVLQLAGARTVPAPTR